MRLVNLTLSQFRNFTSLQTPIPPGPTVVVGANAQGKTSLLEAIYYLVGAWSPHTFNDRQLIRLGADPPVARLVADLERAGRSERIEIRLLLDPDSGPEGRLRKQVLVNGVRVRPVELHGRFNAVLFLPQDVEVVEGPPAGRRQQLDATLSQADPGYAAELLEYGRVLTRRNALLKQLQDRRPPSGQLDFWDEKLSLHGAQLMSRRGAALRELSRLAAPIHAELSAGQEALSIDYLPGFSPPIEPSAESWPLEALRAGLAAELRRLRTRELERGITLTGPQRDDLAFGVNGTDLRQYGSRGQNRTAVLSYKLAEAGWLLERTGDQPVLLLDEVLAELDPRRRTDLLQRLERVPQFLLTAADAEMLGEDFLSRSTVWALRNGRLNP